MNAFPNKTSAIAIAVKTLSILGVLALGTATVHAALDEEVQFIFNTFSFLIWGALVMWMCAGFTMLEAGCGSHQERLP